jgi:hypothetical protein
MEYRIHKTKKGTYAIQKKMLFVWMKVKEYNSQGRAMNELKKIQDS